MVKVRSKAIGKVIHFFDKISVAVVRLSGKVAVGDVIKFTGHDLDFTQTISSMQIDHKQVTSGKKGDEVAILTDQPVKEGMEMEKE